MGRSERQTNILLMIADDLGRDTGCLGNPAAETPNLDRFASEGVIFEQAFCTTATCSASRSVIYTGVHNHQSGHYGHCHGHHHFMTLDSIESAPRIFNRAGYLTAIVGKIHVGPDHVYPWQMRLEGFQGNRDVAAMSRAAGAVFRQDPGRPFFLTVGFGDPHRDGTRKGFANRDYPGVERRRFPPEEVVVPSFLPDLPEVREELAEYTQSVHRLDQGVGMILRELEDSGRAADTLVLFVSDNGIPFPGSKTTLFEPGIHLPMFLRIPGAHGAGVRGAAGVRNPNLVSYTDILPSLLDWAGIRAPNPLRKGRSLLSIASESRELPDWAEIYCSHTFHEVTNYYPTRVLRTRGYKYHKNVVWKADFPFASDLYASLTWEAARKTGGGRLGKRTLRDYVQRPHEELYDLEADPDEVRNLAADPAHRETLLDMRRRVERWQEQTDDPWLFKDGVSVRAVRRYVEQGLALPDRHDMEV